MRPRPGLLTVVAAVAAGLLIAIGIGTPLLGLRTFSGVDMLKTYEPWRSMAPAGFRPQLPSISDTVDSVLPWHHYFQRELADGNLPSWNPLLSGGTAFGSTPGPGFYSPLGLPYLVLPTWLAPAFAKLLEMIVTIGGTFLFLRRLRVGPPAALLGGMLFASSGFMVSWTNWQHTQVAALIPALFWALERFAQRPTARSSVPIAVVVAVMLLAGFPAIAGYACYAAVPYLVMRLLQLHGRSVRRIVGGALTAGTALALGAGAVAVVLLPFLAQLQQLDYLEQRAQTPQVHLPPLMLLTAAVWRAFGSEADGDGYWGPISQIEGMSFIGAGALVLIGFAVLRRPAPEIPRGVRGYFIVATLVTVVLGYAGGPLLGLAQKLPVFSDNPVFRIRSVLGFFLAVLAAMGYEALVRQVAARRGRLAVAVEAAGWLLAAAAAFEAGRRLLAVGADVGREPYVREQLLWAALPAVGVLLAGTIATLSRHRSTTGGGRLRLVALAAVPVIVLVESLTLLLPFWPRVPKSDFYPVTGAHRYLQENLGHERYGAKGLTLFSGTNVYYDLRNVTGHAFTTEEWKELLLTVDPGVFATPTFSRFSGRTDGQTLRSPLLDLLSVQYFAFAPQDPVLGTRTTSGAAGLGSLLQPGRSVVVPIGPGKIRGVGVSVRSGVRPADRFAALDVAIVGASGRTLAQGSRRLHTEVRPGRFVVPVAGEDVPASSGPLSARLTLRSDRPLAVAPRLDVVRPDPADGLRLVYSGGAVVYERGTAEPRFRWADHEQVIADKTERLTVLANVRDPGRVVLDEPGPVRAERRPATVFVLEDSTDGSVTRVSASGAGYLVVADCVQVGWEASVDGRSVPLVAADHALVAVPVPAGEHEVRLRYVPPGRSTGTVVSLLSLLGIVVLAVGPQLGRVLARRARRPARPHRVAAAAPGPDREPADAPRAAEPADR